MYSVNRTYRRGRIIVASPGRIAPPAFTVNGLGGGLDPPSAECPQPVHTNERDALRAKLEKMVGYYGQRPYGQHWHEGHPDVRAWLDDLIPRVKGLYDRPKLLRCSAEARKKANEWWGTFQWVGSQVRTEGSFLRGGATRVPKGGLYVRTYNLRDYNFREGHPLNWGANKPPAQPVEKEEGVPFDPSVGGAGGDPTKSGAGRVTALEQAAIDAGLIQPRPAGSSSPTTGAPGGDYAGAGAGAFGGGSTVMGIPTSYLLLGGAALVAMKFLK